MAYTTINDPTLHFQVKAYSGTGSSNAITLDGATDMAPDMVYLKRRDAEGPPMIFDTIRGAGKRIQTNNTDTEATHAQQLTAFGSDGFTVGTHEDANHSSGTYVSWNWKAGGEGSANSEGNTTTTKTSANTTSGFSIITYEGDGAAATLGHGLGAVPHFIIQKNLDDTENWQVYHHKNTSAPETDYLTLNTTNATGDQASRWNDTAPTSTLITIGSDTSVSQSGESMVMYAWTEKKGYSKFGSYKGNGNANGTFISTGFRPAMIIIKRTDSTDHWLIYDDQRGYNGDIASLRPNESHNESTASGYEIDILSNGFKARQNHNDINGSGNTYIYASFATAPLVNTSGIPCNAR